MLAGEQQGYPIAAAGDGARRTRPRGTRRRAATGPPRAALALTLLLLTAFVAVALAAPADAAAKPREAKLDLQLERTPIIVHDAYRRLPPMGTSGAMGGNLQGSGFEVADQHLGDLYVRAGLVHRRAKLIRRGFKAFDYAFDRQRSDGSFPEDQTEAYAFFVQAVAHSALLVRATKYKREFRKKLGRYERKLERAAAHMVAPFAWAGFKSRNPSYTHSGYSTGTALALTGKLAGNRRLGRFGRSAIRQALDNQRRSGVNPELGGYDVRYQTAGLQYAERFHVYFPSAVRRGVERMTNRGIRWMRKRVAGNGYIKWKGSTRACRELNSNGNPKTPGYSFAVRAFAYWGALEDRPRLLETAQKIDRYARLAGGDSLCGPKQEIERPEEEEGSEEEAAVASGSGRGGGGPIGRILDPIRQDDLLE